jgi:hypothetical protein
LPAAHHAESRGGKRRDIVDDLRKSDAFISIVMVLEHGDTTLNVHGRQLAEAVETVRAACAAAAHEEVAAVRCELVAKGAEASVDLAHTPADNRLWIHQVGGAAAAVVVFGSLRVHAGYELSMTWVPS